MIKIFEHIAILKEILDITNDFNLNNIAIVFKKVRGHSIWAGTLLIFHRKLQISKVVGMSYK